MSTPKKSGGALYNKTSEKIRLDLFTAMTLFLNAMETFKHREQLGYVDSERSFESFIGILRNEGIHMTFADLEALLWSGQMQAEGGRFWHPYDQSYKIFLREVLQSIPKRFKVTYDKDLCLLDVEYREQQRGANDSFERK